MTGAARTRTVLLGAIAVVVLAAAVTTAAPAVAATPVRQVGCTSADQPITITRSTTLDPTCTYSGGITITASGVTLDCRGAHVDAGDGRSGVGILVTAPVDSSLHDITIEHCVVHGFLNGVRITRSGFKTLPPGHEYDHGYAHVRVVDDTITDTGGVGLYVDAYVTGVSIDRLDVERAGSTGIYLEAGSRGTLVRHSTIVDNGYAEVSPDGYPFVFHGVTFMVVYTGREGIAVDGARDNVIRDNLIQGNSYGGVFLYENCGEDATTDPADWWPRRYGADGNLIEGNTIEDEPNGVWIGSRMAEDQADLDCSTPAYYPPAGVVGDHATGNAVSRNRFVGVTHGVRVEDDDNRVLANRFEDATSPGSAPPPVEAVLVGTKYRTEVLGQPVTGTVVEGNRSDLSGVASPYAVIHGETDTTFRHNWSTGRQVAALVPGVQPVINPILFVISIWLPPPS